MKIQAELAPGLRLDRRRALWIAAGRALVIADAHWGYAATHRAAGNLLPAWGDDELETTLDALRHDYEPAQLIFLGDVVHGRAGRARAGAYLAALPGDLTTTVLRGNHDRQWEPPCPVHASLTLHHLFLHHGDQPLDPPLGHCAIVGHHHPAYVYRDGAGSRLKLPAAVVGPNRIILPAFSPWAAGTPWNDRLETGEILWAIAPRRILAVPTEQRSLRP